MNQYLSNKSAADYLGYSASTLRNARHTGVLAGVEAPPYRKIGTTIRYEKETLEIWLSQFKPLSKIDKEA